MVINQNFLNFIKLDLACKHEKADALKKNLILNIYKMNWFPLAIAAQLCKVGKKV